MKEDVPIGIRTIHKLYYMCCPHAIVRKTFWYQCSVLFLTYISYTSYHMTRKPISVVKNVLHRNCSGVIPDSSISPEEIASNPNWCDWEPFEGENSRTLFGILDSSFLFVYAFAMFFSGVVAERVSLRYFLSFGMMLSGIFCYMFGLAKTYNIHQLWYFIFVQVFAGAFQTTGWPGVVTVVGRWCGKNKRGLIFGIWNSHTSVGNILGTLTAASFIETDWALSFLIPGAIMTIVGFILFLFLVDDPMSVHVEITPSKRHYRRLLDHEEGSDDDAQTTLIPQQDHTATRWDVRHSVNSEWSPILDQANTTHGNQPSQPNVEVHDQAPADRAVGFLGALRIPGVIEYSCCLFFSKLVSYTFLYWLPKYIQNSTTMGPKQSADLSTLFDVGGILGAVIAGAISDWSGKSAVTCAAMLGLAVPTLLIYQRWGAISMLVSSLMLLLAGGLVNGPYALITTAVSAELGTQVQGDSHALATVTAIIDGTGSLGAAVGPLLAGLVSEGGWPRVFYMLMVSDVLALVMLSRLIFHDCKRIWANERVE